MEPLGINLLLFCKSRVPVQKSWGVPVADVVSKVTLPELVFLIVVVP